MTNEQRINGWLEELSRRISERTGDIKPENWGPGHPDYDLMDLLAAVQVRYADQMESVKRLIGQLYLESQT